MGSFVPATSANLAEFRVNLPRRKWPVEESTHCFCAHLNILVEVDVGLGGRYRGKVMVGFGGAKVGVVQMRQ